MKAYAIFEAEYYNVYEQSTGNLFHGCCSYQELNDWAIHNDIELTSVTGLDED